MQSKDKYISYALALLLVMAPFFQGGTTYYGWAVIRVIVLCIILLAFINMGDKPGPAIPRHWTTAALSLLAIILIINTFRAPYKFAALTWCLNYACYAVVLITAAGLNDSGKRLIFIVLGACAFIQAGWGVAEYLAHLEPRSNGAFFNPNYFGGYLAAVAVWIFGSILFRPAEVKKPGRFVSELGILTLLKTGALLLLVAGVIVSESRGAFIALSVGIFIVGLAKWGWGIFPVSGIMALLFLLVPNPLVNRLKTLEEVDIYAWKRFDIWESAFSMIGSHPTGVGTGMYRFFSPRHAFPVEDIFGRYGQIARMAHSTYLDLAVELSSLSAIIVVGVGIYLIWVGFKRVRNGSGIYCAGAMGALVVIMTHAAVDSIHKGPPVAITAALAAGLLLSAATETSKRIELKVPRRMSVYGTIFALLFAWVIMAPALGYAFLNKARTQNLPKAVAAQWLSRALWINPGNAHLWLQWGYFHKALWMETSEKTDFTEALEAFKMAEELNPVEGGYPVNRAGLLEKWLEANEWSEEIASDARAAYERAVHLEPFNPFYRTKLAVFLKKTGDNEAAEKQLLKTLELEPRFIGARVLLAEALAERGAVPESIQHYREALNVNDEIPPPPHTVYVGAMIATSINKDEIIRIIGELEAGPEKFAPEGD